MKHTRHTASDQELAARMAALDPCWRLERKHGQLVLYGNGAPAAWTADESCIDWLERWEKDAARREIRARKVATMQQRDSEYNPMITKRHPRPRS